MKTCILVHSKTGTTLRFGEIIAKKIREKGHSVDLIRLETDPPLAITSTMQKKDYRITNLPDSNRYDLILIGGPIWAFTVSPVAIACIRQFKDLHGKQLIPFVTMGFPFGFLGGMQGIAAMSRQAVMVGAEVLPGKVIPQMFHNPQKLMQAAADEIAASIT